MLCSLIVYAYLMVVVERVASKGREVEHYHSFWSFSLITSSDPRAPNRGVGLSDIVRRRRKGKGILPTYFGGFLTLVSRMVIFLFFYVSILLSFLFCLVP